MTKAARGGAAPPDDLKAYQDRLDKLSSILPANYKNLTNALNVGAFASYSKGGNAKNPVVLGGNGIIRGTSGANKH